MLPQIVISDDTAALNGWLQFVATSLPHGSPFTSSFKRMAAVDVTNVCPPGSPPFNSCTTVAVDVIAVSLWPNGWMPSVVTTVCLAAARFLNYTYRWPQLMRPMSDSFISSSSRMAAIDATTSRRLRRYRLYQRVIEMRMVLIVITKVCPMQPATQSCS